MPGAVELQVTDVGQRRAHFQKCLQATSNDHLALAQPIGLGRVQ
jgi:hypothetical protein